MASKLAANIITPIGIAVSSPAIPTSGAEIAPNIKGSKPSNADALPAICPWSCIARENDAVEMIPMEEIKIKIDKTTA